MFNRLCLLLMVGLAVVSTIQAKPAPVKSPAPADHSIELAIPSFSAIPESEPEPAKEPEMASAQPVSAYRQAYGEYQASGKMIVYIGASWCPHCPKAKADFEKRAQGRSDCVVLDIDRDDEAKEIMDGYRSVPVIFVFDTVDGKQTKKRHNASQRDLDTIFAKQGQASFAAECLSCSKCSNCSCSNCPRDCAANGCNCSESSNSSNGSKCCGLVRGQPVRNTIKAVVGVAKWVKQKQPVQSLARRLCGRCR